MLREDPYLVGYLREIKIQVKIIPKKVGKRQIWSIFLCPLFAMGFVCWDKVDKTVLHLGLCALSFVFLLFLLLPFFLSLSLWGRWNSLDFKDVTGCWEHLSTFCWRTDPWLKSRNKKNWTPEYLTNSAKTSKEHGSNEWKTAMKSDTLPSTEVYHRVRQIIGMKKKLAWHWTFPMQKKFLDVPSERLLMIKPEAKTVIWVFPTNCFHEWIKTIAIFIMTAKEQKTCLQVSYIGQERLVFH